MIDPGLQGKAAIVTGGNSGIGAAIVQALAAQGVKVAVHYHPGKLGKGALHTVPGKNEADRIVEAIRAAGGQAIAVGVDLADEHAADLIFDPAERELGPITLLVNNAAHCEEPDTLAAVSAQTLDRHFAINARAAVMLCQTLAARMEQRGISNGAVVNISTDAARAFSGQIAYGASKYALEALTRSIAIELGPKSIRVNAIAPGPVQTGWMDDALIASVTPSIPLRRVGLPQDIADGVVFLCSRQAAWITGAILRIAGGHAL